MQNLIEQSPEIVANVACNNKCSEVPTVKRSSNREAKDVWWSSNQREIKVVSEI